MVDMVPPLELGVITLGVFVGWLLGVGLKNSSQTLKAVLTVLGAALGGGPILFMKGIGPEKWMYPIGLLLGLLWVRLSGARIEIVQKRSGRNKVAHAQGWFAWVDLILISAVTLGALVYASLPGSIR
jgi:hypothetical protein